MEFLEAAQNEGFKTIQKWILSVARNRSRQVSEDISRGEYIQLDGKVVLFRDLPGDVEIKKRKS